jgi:hypothetical protein
VDRITRRSAIAAGAALAVGACSDEAPSSQWTWPIPYPEYVARVAEIAAELPVVDPAVELPEYAPRLAEIAEEKRAVAAWIEEHRDALPSSYHELVRLPSAYRVPVALALPVVLASAIMDEHLQRAGADAGRTEEQREVIADVRAYMSPTWWAGEPVARAMAWQREIGERVDETFTLADRIRIFESIGPEDDGIRRRIADRAA